jgi:hypothetical protein
MIDSAAAPQILVRQVEQLLVVRVRVHRCHPALDDAERFVQHFGDRRKAIGRAGRVRNDLVLRRVVLRVVDAKHEHGIRPLGGRGDHHALGAALQVLARVVALGNLRPLEDDVHA